MATSPDKAGLLQVGPAPLAPDAAIRLALDKADKLAFDLWEHDPIETLERLRGLVVRAISLATEVYRRAKAAPATARLDVIDDELCAALWRAIDEAQAIWFATPASKHIERPDGPVYLHYPGDQPIEQVGCTCYHDLALAVAVGTARFIDAALPASDYVRAWERYTAPMANVEQRLGNLVAEVRCESHRAIGCVSDATSKRDETRSRAQAPRHPAESTLPVSSLTPEELDAIGEALRQNAMLSSGDIAKLIGCSHGSVENFLRRHAKTNMDCRVELTEPCKNRPRCLYRLGDVVPALSLRIAEWKAKAARQKTDG